MIAALSSVNTLILAEALALGWLVLIGFWWIDRYDERLLPATCAVFLWGGVIELIFLLMTSHGVLARLAWALLHKAPWTVQLVPPVLEVLGLLVIVWIGRDGDSPVDLFVFGTAMGTGFGVVWLMVHAGLSHVSQIPAGELGHLAVGVFFGLLWTMLAGGTAGTMIGFGRLRASAVAFVAWTAGALGFTTAILLGVPKIPGWLRIAQGGRTVFDLAVVTVLIVVLVTVLYWGERTILRRELEEEAELGVVPRWVPEIVPFYTRRIRSRWWPERRERIVLARLLSKLAFRKHRLRGHRKHGSELAGLEIVTIREHLARMLAPAGDREV